ncbi:hypothetical protein L249_1614 [Ophiocordyceps polyrhachis-furcata BCC 54312]|uniref:PB1 domain-containing protein n=1 Tax=Ophiocordyceps polyrhachis-furcata BCC 54312 TaxID=1330021 RepID=A0A367KZM9_9HYPO|nr:hypothetical protein L249_1614 [Ophiocordyceps polyrhachis-furcata BCC 54312]
MGVIHATLGEHEKAVECYQRAIRLDQYLAVAYFQQGVSSFLLGDFEEALANFNDTLLYLRGNTQIDYAQLGLFFKLYSCEVLFNRGLCYIYLQQMDAGMQDLVYAVKEKVVEDHNVIDEAIGEEAEGYTVFSIPVGVVYRPNDAKVRNLKTKDYLGKARLVAASDRANAFTGFAGSEIKNAAKTEVKDDRPTDNISFAATNLVRPELMSRRQQSEPPGNRNVFPPTPPPENDRPSRGASVRSGGPRPPAKLSISSDVTSSRRYLKSASPQDNRPWPARSASASTASRGFPQRPSRQPVDDEDMYPDDLYDMYQGGGGYGQRGSRPNNRARQRYDDDDGSDYDDGSLDGAEFEMVSNNRRGPSYRSGSRAPSRRGDVRKLRIKVHADDVRYVMVGVAIEFPDLVDCVREKFNLRRRFKMKIPDDEAPDGDLITLGDQDDLEMAIQFATDNARRQRQDVAKMEIWVYEV